MPKIVPIKKGPTTPDKIAQQIITLIANNKLKPGDELPTQGELASGMRVSRASVREALIALEAKGFVKKKPNGAYIITGITSPKLIDPLEKIIKEEPKLVWEVLEMAKVLIVEAARLAAERATDEEISQIGKAVAKLEKAKGDKAYFRKEFSRAYIEFYRTLGTATKNTVYLHLIYSFNEMLKEAMPYPLVMLARVPNIASVIYEQHKKIWKSLEERKPSAAAKSAKQHFDYIEERLREVANWQKDKGMNGR